MEPDEVRHCPYLLSWYLRAIQCTIVAILFRSGKLNFKHRITWKGKGWELWWLVSRFDILVNGGGSVKLELMRDPFKTVTASVLVPWNQIITMDTVYMVLDGQTPPPTSPKSCSAEHPHYNLRPVVLSTWQHTQLGACPDHSTIIPESQVISSASFIDFLSFVLLIFFLFFLCFSFFPSFCVDGRISLLNAYKHDFSISPKVLHI